MFFEEVPHFAPMLPGPEEAARAAAAVVPGPPHPVPPPSPEQVRAAEALFAAQERESNAVAGLLGMWTGVMLLNDLAQEHFSPPAGELEEEEEREPRVKK
jgi:hypothetical protein